ncbi:MAG: hypothetical protein IIC60_01430 [Proteobacteria bacterium]|nr:hypothetical protein [Pseudomonadota bacterium]
MIGRISLVKTSGLCASTPIDNTAVTAMTVASSTRSHVNLVRIATSLWSPQGSQVDSLLYDRRYAIWPRFGKQENRVVPGQNWTFERWVNIGRMRLLTTQGKGGGIGV